MESSLDFARKHGLERFLEKPDELNTMIFKLILLQDTIQLEETQKTKANAQTISVKRSAHGKFVALCRGDVQYRYAVETALRASTSVIAVFQRGRFVQMLHSMGLPEGAVRELCGSVFVDDDTHCADPE
jgi:hypothetical protein